MEYDEGWMVGLNMDRPINESDAETFERRRVNQLQAIQDHDLLIRLEGKMDNFMSQYAVDMNELKTGTSTKLADLELRMKAVEQVQHDAKLTYKFMLGAAAAVGSIITFILSVVIGFFNLFKNGN